MSGGTVLFQHADDFHDACQFRCIGCPGQSSPNHAKEAVREHMSLLLNEVLRMRKFLPDATAPASPAKLYGLTTFNSERLPGPFSGPTPSASSTALVDAAAQQDKVSASAALAAGLRRRHSTLPPLLPPQGEPSEHDELLRLLEDAPPTALIVAPQAQPSHPALAAQQAPAVPDVQMAPAIPTAPAASEVSAAQLLSLGGADGRPLSPPESLAPSSPPSPQAVDFEPDEPVGQPLAIPPEVARFPSVFVMESTSTDTARDAAVRASAATVVANAGTVAAVGPTVPATAASMLAGKTLTLPGAALAAALKLDKEDADPLDLLAPSAVDMPPFAWSENPPQQLALSPAVRQDVGASEIEEINRRLNRVTSALQAEQLTNTEAAAEFSAMIEVLPVGKLRCSALLNRAHCQVHLGRLEAALEDTNAILQGEQSSNFDATKWHKVWLIRGTIHRKLAQNAGGDQTLYAKARADYARVLEIQPEHADSMAKARRALEQLDVLQRGASVVGGCRRSVGGASVAASAETAAVLDAGAALPASPRRAGPNSALPASPRRLNAVSTSSNDHKDMLTSEGGDASEPGSKRRRIEAANGTSVGSGAVDAALARRSLAALGRDSVVAGIALYGDGAVRERTTHSVARANERSPAVDEPTPPRSPPRGALAGNPVPRRCFEIRIPQQLGDGRRQVETVTLEASRLVGADGQVGDCSCWLRGSCKHVAAALCAISKQEASAATEGGVGLLLAATSDAVAAGAAEKILRSFTKDQLELAERRLEKRTIEELKGLLRLNNQLLSGTKGELLRRLVDCAVNGALPPCSNCGGHLHPEAGVRFRCRKTNRDREPCGYEVSNDEVERLPFKGADQLL